MWRADKAYAYGKNLDSVNQYVPAFSFLNSAVNTSPGEPTFRDELAHNESVIALALFEQASGSAQEKINQTIPGTNLSAATLGQKAIADSDKVISISPNVLQFWKTRTKLFYNLAQINQQYLNKSLQSIEKAVSLAPTDAKVHYNYGLILGQSGDLQNAIKIMQETTKLKPDYADAYYALGLYFDQLGQKDKAREQMEYMLSHIGADARAQKWLEEDK